MSFPYCPIGPRDLCQVDPNGAFGAVGIARGDGVVDRLVRTISHHVLARLLQRNRPLLGQPGNDRLVQCREDRIARDQREHIVERHVGPFKSCDTAERLTVGVERALELAEVRLRRIFGGMAGQPDFEHGARLLKMAHTLGRSEQMARRPGQGVEHDLRRGHGDARPLAAVDGHHSHLLERKQRLAHGRTADSEQLHQVAFGRQLIAGRVAPFLDHFLQPRRDILVELASLNDPLGFWYTYHTRSS